MTLVLETSYFEKPHQLANKDRASRVPKLQNIHPMHEICLCLGGKQV
jgi:hypothetical protein